MSGRFSLFRRRRLAERFIAPAMVCDEGGVIREINLGARTLLESHSLPTDRLAGDAWPRIDGSDVAEVQMVRTGLRFSRHRLGGGRWLVLPRTVDDPALTSRLYRSAHELLARTISTVAHDLRSPLASLFFNIGVLKNRWNDLAPTQVEATLEAMSRACELEMKIVAALVERIDTTGPNTLPLGALFDRVGELLNPLFRGGTNVLEIQVDRDAEVLGASMVLDQIFVNLIGNAVESQPGPVTVRIESAERRGDPRRVAILVSNDGPPIDAAQRARIFQPFFTTKPTGTGMGLTFAREAARQLGGDLMLLPRARTVFEVRLPKRRDES